MEQTIQIVKTFESGSPDSLVVVIPKEVREQLNIEKGAKFIVKIDEQGRIIYEPIR